MQSRYRLNLLSFVFALSLLGFPQSNTADKGPAPQDYSKEAYVIEHVETQVVIQEDGSNTRQLSAEIKMLADAGVKEFAVLDFAYTSDNEVIEVDYVRVQKSDGSVIKTPDYNIQDMPADITRTAPLYSDIHEKHIAVKGLGIGDTLQYQIRYRVLKPQVPGQFWYEYSFSDSHIVKDEQLEISLPKTKYVKAVSPDFKPEIKEQDARRIYHWTYSNLQRKEKNADEVPKKHTPNPSIQLTTFANWEEIGRWYDGLQKDAVKVTPAIQAKAAELTKGLNTDDEKIRAIYSFVSLRFHYIGLDFGIGRYQPHAAEDVLGNEYGDCKDKHTLLTSLLKAAGYEAWPALIHTSRKLDEDVPSLAQFDHVITVVPIGDKLTWLDTTPEVAPFGWLSRMLRGKQALVIPINKPSALIRTPENPPFLQDQKLEAQGKLSTDGTLTAHMTMKYRGDAEVVYREVFRQVSQAQWKEVMQKISMNLGYGGDVDNVQATSIEDIEQPFFLSYDYVRKDYGEKEEIPPFLPSTGMEAGQWLLKKKPSEPVPLGSPGEILYSSRIELPSGYSVTTPKNVDVVESYAEYHSSYELKDHVLICSRKLVIKKKEVALSDWEGYQKLGKTIFDDETNYIQLSGVSEETHTDASASSDGDKLFREGGEALQQNEMMRAEELFRKVIAVNPAYPGAHFNLGLTLGGQNKLSDALAEIRKEEEIQPSNEKSYDMAVSLLTYMHHSHEEIASEWRKLLKANPKSYDAAMNLSMLQIEDGKYADAVAVLEGAVKLSPESSSLQRALNMAWLKNGQIDKALPGIQQQVATQITAKKIDPAMLNNVAYTLAQQKTHLDLAKDYAEKAVTDIESQSAAAGSDEVGIQLAYPLWQVWDTLGWVYFQMDDLTHAAEYVHCAWLLGHSVIAADHLGQIYEKQGKKTEAAHLYALALAASSPNGNNPWAATKANARSHSDILAAYKKLTGSTPSTSTHRLPNGEWTRTPAEELNHVIRLGRLTSASGGADFAVALLSAKVDSVSYLSGNTAFKSLIPKLQTVKYDMEFPAGSTAKIVRHIVLSCYPSEGCTMALLQPEAAKDKR